MHPLLTKQIFKTNKMKHLKSIIAVFVLTLSFNFSLAQSKLENSTLWKIEHADLKQPSYLLGTLHLMCASDFAVPQKVTEALKNVDALVLEVNTADPQEMKLMQEAMGNAKKISEELSPKQFADLDQLVTKVIGAPLKTFDTYGLSILQFLMIGKMLPCTDLKYYEMELIASAQKDKKAIFSLEKAADQIVTMQKAYPTAFAFDQLMLFDSYKKDFNASIAAYKNEDITTSVNLITKDIYMDKNATKYMQIERNKNWVEKMPKMMTERSNLFAVGAAHLTDEYGLINLLRQKGYTVTPVLN